MTDYEATISRPRPFIVAAATFLFLLQLAILYLGVPLALSGRADFRQLYTAGYMVRSGHAREIYDYDSERRFQNAVVSPEDVALPFDHLAYEALLLAPFSMLEYRAAYIAVLIVNLLLLALSLRLLSPKIAGLAQLWSWLPVAMFACFLPVAIALIQGQDSILLLTLMAAACVLLDRGHESIAGAFVGLALFKLQFAIPIALLFFVWRRWRFAAGFALAGTFVLALSLWMAGVGGFAAYAHALVSMSARLSTAADQYRYGIYPAQMPNLRGLTYAALYFSPRSVQVITALCSVLVLLYASFKRPSFSLAIVVALLVSYHGLIHDMSLLVIPAGRMFAAGLAGRPGNTKRMIALAVTLLVAPAVLFQTGGFYCLLALPLLGGLTAIEEAANRGGRGFDFRFASVGKEGKGGWPPTARPTPKGC